MANIVVLDYGTSNLRSVAKALEHVSDTEHQITVSDKAGTILAADRVVFPGQGAVGQCMNSLKEKELDEVILECIKNKPFLGICLGLQSLMDHSDEDGGVDCLGIIPGQVRRFTDAGVDEQGNLQKIPHMGWNQVWQSRNHPLWDGIKDGERFYFVHSYYVCPDNVEDIVAETDYITRFVSAVARDNIFATQFHPEKSQHAGLSLLKNFLTWEL
ncbi:MAG TPA: imidazole glycerol phosphate synthase subunit HisH [Gammaproteobacteria bacterium]